MSCCPPPVPLSSIIVVNPKTTDALPLLAQVAVASIVTVETRRKQCRTCPDATKSNGVLTNRSICLKCGCSIIKLTEPFECVCPSQPARWK